jgi:hypothetical protein
MIVPLHKFEPMASQMHNVHKVVHCEPIVVVSNSVGQSDAESMWWIQILVLSCIAAVRSPPPFGARNSPHKRLLRDILRIASAGNHHSEAYFSKERKNHFSVREISVDV